MQSLFYIYQSEHQRYIETLLSTCGFIFGKTGLLLIDTSVLNSHKRITININVQTKLSHVDIESIFLN